MTEDLLDAQAAVDWAITQLPTLQARIDLWRDSRPYSLRSDLDSEPGKKLYRLTGVMPVPNVINAEVGNIIHSIRSSLDILAVALAARNGHKGGKEVYFPISESLAAFNDLKRGGGKEKIRRLSAADQFVIESLQPYNGGNDKLFALHRLDRTRKHSRLLHVSIFPRGVEIIGFPLGALTFANHWDGFKDETLLAWTDPATADGDLKFGLNVALSEVGVMEGIPVAAAISDFASLANSILVLFR